MHVVFGGVCGIKPHKHNRFAPVSGVSRRFGNQERFVIKVHGHKDNAFFIRPGGFKGFECRTLPVNQGLRRKNHGATERRILPALT